METIANSTIAISLISLIISIVVFVRWWGMTTDIKEIKNFLLDSKKPEQKPVVKDVPVTITADEDEKERVELLVKKLKPNQCVVKIKLNNGKLEIWDKAMWDEHVELGRAHNFDLMHKNF